MKPGSPLLELARALREAGEAIQRAVLGGDVAALPELVERERNLADQLNRALAARWPTGRPVHGGGPEDPPGELQALIRAWWRTHEQNRLLLEHAHRTVVELIALLSGSAAEPVGLYSPGAAGRTAVRIDRRA